MAGSNIYIAPYEKKAQAILAGNVWLSPEIEIPYYAAGFVVSFESDKDGTLEIQREINGAFKAYDSLPITGGDPTIPTKVYNFRFPKIKMLFTPTGGVAAVINAIVDITPAVQG
jgi:hypothetical protein